MKFCPWKTSIQIGKGNFCLFVLKTPQAMQPITSPAKLASGSDDIFLISWPSFWFCFSFSFERRPESRTLSNFDVGARYFHLKINVFNKHCDSVWFGFHDLAQRKNELYERMTPSKKESFSSCYLCQFFLLRLTFSRKLWCVTRLEILSTFYSNHFFIPNEKCSVENVRIFYFVEQSIESKFLFLVI